MNHIRTLLPFSLLIMQSLYHRNIVVDKVLCDEKEKRKCFVDVLQSHSNEYGKPEHTCLLTEGNMFC